MKKLKIFPQKENSNVIVNSAYGKKVAKQLKLKRVYKDYIKTGTRTHVFVVPDNIICMNYTFIRGLIEYMLNGKQLDLIELFEFMVFEGGSEYFNPKKDIDMAIDIVYCKQRILLH